MSKPTTLSLIILLILTVPLVSCADYIKSKKAIGNFSITVTDNPVTNAKTATLTGDNIDSALWISSYKIVYEKNNVKIMIEKALSNTGYSGPYRLQFVVPGDTERILLGDEEVWGEN